MDDPHQLNTILTAAIYEFFKDRTAGPIGVGDLVRLLSAETA